MVTYYSIPLLKPASVLEEWKVAKARMWGLLLVEITTTGNVSRHMAKPCSVEQAPTCREASAHKSAD